MALYFLLQNANPLELRGQLLKLLHTVIVYSYVIVKLRFARFFTEEI